MDSDAFNPDNITLSDTSTNWLQLQAEMHPHLNTTAIERACFLAEQCDADNLAYGQQIAELLLDITADSHAIAAAIALPATMRQSIDKTQLIQIVSLPVYNLLNGVHKMAAIQATQERQKKDSQYQHQIDKLRKMLLAMVDDIRIVLIKLAEQVITLQRLKNEPDAVRIDAAKQTMTVYAPLANRLGIGQLKWQLEDMAFRYLQWDKYKEISKALNMRRVERETFIHRVVNRLKQLLASVYITDADISGRAKHIFSIYRKIQRKQVDLSEIYDASAVRVLVDDVQDCYTVLGLVHAAWEHIPKEFDDYIAHPKANGYRSIHTAVYGPDDHIVEIQIRTKSMHEEAELGIAAHWVYKEGKAQESSYERKISWLRQVMDWQQDLSANEDNPQLYQDTFEDQVYVFTPGGDVVDMTLGATALDFAYHIHTDVGHRCRGARINDQLKPITTKLKTGDKVEIITAKSGAPSRDWLIPQLGYLGTHRAMHKVRLYFRQEAYQQKLDAGIEIWEKTRRKYPLTRQDLEQYAKDNQFSSANSVLAAIGSGDIQIQTVLQSLPTRRVQTTESKDVVKLTLHPSDLSSSGFIIEGETDLLTHIAQCCKPIPGDAVCGFITLGRGITIHKEDCRNLQHLQTQTPERIIQVQWGSQHGNYPVDISVHAKGIVEDTLVREVISQIANSGYKVLALHSSHSTSKDEVSLTITLMIDGYDNLQKLLAGMQNIPNVVVAKRVD